MASAHRVNDVPRGALVAAGVMIALSISAAGVTRLAGGYVVDPPPASPAESRDLRFEDQPDRGIAVYDAGTGTLVASLEPGSHGFVRGLLRGLSRDRLVHRVGPDVPFTLTRWSDGRHSITDPATGSVIHLAAYGFGNVQEFASLLQAATTGSTPSKEVRP